MEELLINIWIINGIIFGITLLIMYLATVTYILFSLVLGGTDE